MRGFHLPIYKDLLFSQPLTSFKLFLYSHLYLLVLLTITCGSPVWIKYDMWHPHLLCLSFFLPHPLLIFVFFFVPYKLLNILQPSMYSSVHTWSLILPTLTEKKRSIHLPNDFWILDMIFPSSENLLQRHMYHHFFTYQLFITQKKWTTLSGWRQACCETHNNIRDSVESWHANRVHWPEGVGVGLEYDIWNCMNCTWWGGIWHIELYELYPKGWSTFNN
jgi:hypothetical protein